MFMEKSSVLKWSKFFGVLAVSTMFWACSSSDDKSVAGGSTEDAGIVAIKDLDVAGVTQKGPFVKGSAVTVQGIDCKTLKQTDEHFEGEVKSDKGDFTVKEVSLKSTCALFEVTGLYRSEITGKKSSKELTLRALTDLKDRENVNINILTNLEYERLLHLVTEKGKTFAEAKAQAEAEVLAAFDIAGSFEEFENLNIFESGDGNAALLAVSVMMQAKTDDAGLAKRLDKFTDSFAETGNWKDSATKATIADWAAGAIAGNGLDSIRKNIESWDIGDTVAAFEKYITAEFPDTVVYSSSSADRSSSSAKANAGSEYDPATNTLKDLRDGKVYKTVTIGDQTWMAENLNYETDSSFCYNDSAEYCAKYGRLYTWAAAMGACPTGWHLPSEEEWNILLSEVGGQSIAGTALKSQSGWHDGGNGTDAFGFSALPAGRRDTVGEFTYDGEYTDFWTTAEGGDDFAYFMFLDYYNEYMPLGGDSKNFALSVRCLKGEALVASSSSSDDSSRSSSDAALSSSGESRSSSSSETAPSWDIPKEAYLNPEIKYDSIVDSRDGQVYKTVKIGNQTWMAQNLNYADSVKTPSLLGRSRCYNDSSKYCEKYGRLYTWAAAMDSVETGCGYSKRGGACYHPTDVKGICPSDWHLPSYDEWKVLYLYAGEEYISGRSLKSKMGWKDDGNGFDDFGFSAIPAGELDLYHFYDEGMHASFWSSTEFDWYASEEAYYLDLSYSDLDAVIRNYEKYHARSVRCIKDGSASVPSSSSVVANSSSSGNSGDVPDMDWSVPKESYLNPNVSYETFVDDRDGKTYKSVKIGNQIWMAENLNYADSVATPSLKKQNWCYDDDEAHCNVIGRLYTWAAAIDSVKFATDKDNPQNCGSKGPCELPEKVQGICPNGWHLPSKAEWGTLLAEASENPQRANAKYFKSSIGWRDSMNGTDDFGFSAIPAGELYIFGFSVDDEHECRSAGYATSFWGAGEDSDGLNGIAVHIQADQKNAVFYDIGKISGASVRCLKD